MSARGLRRGFRQRLAVAVLGIGLAGAVGGQAVADDDGLAKKLAQYELEAKSIATDLPRPDQIGRAPGAKRLVDAEVSFATGDYDAAALVLFDLVGKPGADQEAARYYLAESLFQKGDRGAARTYFADLVTANNVSSKYYQPALQRLVELAILSNDDTDVDKWLHLADTLPAGARQPAIAYVKGKYAFSKDKLDEALLLFGEVPAGSDVELQAKYFTGTTYVAKSDLAKATEVFADLVGRKPKSANDRRVVELSQLALGRLYYERDQPSKSIDSYLLVDRRSDLFPDALYEVGWVYVKNKQYDKALRALELLQLTEPANARTPTVRILEGNLRIRKAQMIRASAVAGTLENGQSGDPAPEYDKADKVFIETHDAYYPSYEALKQMDESKSDPRTYLAQIAGRSPHVFQAAAPIPEAAAQWLREEPNVQRVVGVENDLGDIQTNIRTAEETIARLEGVIAAGDKSTVYPILAGRRQRIVAMQTDLIGVRARLADQQLGMLNTSAALAQVTANRKALADKYRALGNPEQAYSDRIAQARSSYDTLDQAAAEVSSIIDGTQAVAVALRKYAKDAAPALPEDQKANVNQTLDQVAKDAEAVENELDELQQEIVLGRDLAGVGDPALQTARETRKQLRAAEDAEYRMLAGSAGQSRDQDRFRELATLGERAARIAQGLDVTDGEIDRIVASGLVQARATIDSEKKNLVDYKTQLAGFEQESRDVGGTVLGGSFRSVKAKFYDVVVRSDVGSVDVSWSQKEDTDDDLKRLNIARQRDVKQLRDEFKDILDDKTKAPDKKPPPKVIEQPASPDQGSSVDRVKPGSETAKPVEETVKPDDKKDAKTKKDPKKDLKKDSKKDPKKAGAKP